MTARIAALALALVWSVVAAGDVPVETFIQDRVEQIRALGSLEIDGVDIAAIHLLPEFYERRSFAPGWRSPDHASDLLDRIRRTYDEGLDPADYHLAAVERGIEAWAAGELTPGARADLDLVLTDAVIRVAYHQLFGKVDPSTLDPNWNLDRSFGVRDPVGGLSRALEAPSLRAVMDESFAWPPEYDRLRDALVRYRALAADGGWPKVPGGAALKPGMRGPRVAALRERLQLTGEIDDGAVDDPETYDDTLEEAVAGYQRRQGLDADGVAGKQTIAALNVPVEKRIDQLRVNLERGRWVLRNLPGEFVLVNIAGFVAWHQQTGLERWEARVQVGKPYRKTPVFRADMKYVVFNPTWTVPPTILRKDVAPAIKKDVSYLERKNMVLLDRAGNRVDPGTVDWASIDPARFPYVVRQEPGPNNALGRVKFIFPNEHFVFLHDTPSRSLFDRAERTFSSGCIRVEDPLDLAARLLDDQDKWTAETIAETLEGGKQTTVYLSKPHPVLLLYWTVSIDPDGAVGFLLDVYGRDPAVLDALDDEFVIRLPADAPDFTGR